MKILLRLLPVFAISAVLVIAATPARATTVYALTDTGSLLTFDHQTPGTITNNVAVTNLGGYELLAIDERPTVQPGSSQPGVGTLWGIGKSGTSFQLFVIDPVTGAATAIGVPIVAGINSAPADTEWGFDFDPAADRIRLVNSSAADNYRLNPNSGALLFVDGDLAYAAGDPNDGTPPQVDAGAYTTAAFGGAASLFYIDSNLDVLAASADPDSGELETVGSLGTNIDQPNGFDVFNSLALFSVPGATGSSLYSVNLITGAAALVGDFPVSTNVRGLAISLNEPVPPPDNSRPFVKVIGKRHKFTHSSRFNLRIRASDDSGTVAVFSRVVKQSHSFKAARSIGPDLYLAKLRRLQFGKNRVNVRGIDPSGRQKTVKMTVTRR